MREKMHEEEVGRRDTDRLLPNIQVVHTLEVLDAQRLEEDEQARAAIPERAGKSTTDSSSVNAGTCMSEKSEQCSDVIKGYRKLKLGKEKKESNKTVKKQSDGHVSNGSEDEAGEASTVVLIKIKK
eukprot:Platyproteum_vivax@DN4629_c0_g1_i1.p1